MLHHVVNDLGWASLRPLQTEAVRPLLAGSDALLLAPTAGGKTEAAVFPLLSRMLVEDWRGTSVLYVCPLRALLNNLQPRLASYAGWLGRSAELWHGDVAAGARRRMVEQPPDLLLTTPESLEAVLVSASVDERRLLGQVRAVVVDEVHAFAGDDRGWHLLAVLDRVAAVTGRPLQRIGLSATVGNPHELLRWLQGAATDRDSTVVAPPSEGAVTADLELDAVGSLDGAATVLSALHRGEKRLVFADSRRTCEELATRLQARGTQTFVSHSSLSRDERHRSEQAFAEARDCVIVATSTLELGIDVGDLDRVVQIGAPRTVASFLQRLGRTGRRPGSSRNTLFLCRDDEELLRAAGLLRLYADGFVEDVVPPPSPLHLVAQQALALALERGSVTREDVLAAPTGGVPVADRAVVLDHLLATASLDADGGLLFVGPEGERRYGRKHFLELLSVFTADPVFTVLHGRSEIGTVDPLVMTRKVTGPRVLVLAGRDWRVTHVDWPRHRVWVEPSDAPGQVRWAGTPTPQSYDLTNAIRRVLLGADLGEAALTRRAAAQLAAVRAEQGGLVDPGGTVLTRSGEEVRLWTWIGARGNALAAELLQRRGLAPAADRLDNRYVRLFPDASAPAVLDALRGDHDILPEPSAAALEGLKFADLLPDALARRVVASRSVDAPAVRTLTRRRLVLAAQ
ncbi:MAG: DEAD/DEAH box helicase [Mycobacteriales bacterium]